MRRRRAGGFEAPKTRASLPGGARQGAENGAKAALVEHERQVRSPGIQRRASVSNSPSCKAGRRLAGQSDLRHAPSLPVTRPPRRPDIRMRTGRDGGAGEMCFRRHALAKAKNDVAVVGKKG